MNRYTYHQLEDYIRKLDGGEYAGRRNYIGGSTNLSEYITRGVITLPKVRDLILENNSPEAAYKLINELAWREYWHLVWQVRGNEIFEYIRPVATTPRSGLPQSVIDATTGITALDEGIRQLQQTGYIHNHMRMWLAGLICNVAQCDWRIGAEWMHSYLIDGDYASNHLSWQWVAGSYTGKPYLPQQDNINMYTGSSQHGTYLDQSYESIADMAIPPELLQLASSMPYHDSSLPSNSTTIDEVLSSPKILLYSPWTLDPTWHAGSSTLRVLLIDATMYASGSYSQNVFDSIAWYAGCIPNLRILCAQPSDLNSVAKSIIRKSYPGIVSWPGTVEPAEQLYPNVQQTFYPSFSAFWKQTQK